MAPPAALSGPTGGGANNQGNRGGNAAAPPPNAAAINANALAEEPLADGGILPRDAALVKGLLRSMVR